jgi:catechol 2,3-dioxygenase-like lactoylglutathione lyase family enzyme
VGGADLDALRNFWGQTLGLPLTEFGQWQIGVLASAWNLAPDTRFALAGAALPRNFMVELDDYPDEVPARGRAPGALPGGWAMVTFTADSLDSLKLDWRRKPRALRAAPYAGRRAAVTVGPAGEWIEVIEAAAPPR